MPPRSIVVGPLAASGRAAATSSSRRWPTTSKCSRDWLGARAGRADERFESRAAASVPSRAICRRRRSSATTPQWLPALLDEVKPRMSLKCVQPVEWPAGEGTCRRGADLAAPQAGRRRRRQARGRDIHRARYKREPRRRSAASGCRISPTSPTPISTSSARSRSSPERRRRGSWRRSSRGNPETPRKCSRRSMPSCPMRGACT